jgi:hypothetical protein
MSSHSFLVYSTNGTTMGGTKRSVIGERAWWKKMRAKGEGDGVRESGGVAEEAE